LVLAATAAVMALAACGGPAAPEASPSASTSSPTVTSSSPAPATPPSTTTPSAPTASPVPTTPLAPTPAPSSSATGAPYCGITWGSQPKSNPGTSPSATLAAVRSGRHDCYDRLVLDINGRVAGYDVRYVSAVLAEGSGHAVPVRGGAAIAVVVKATSYDNATGRTVYTPSNPAELTDVTGFRTLRQVAWGGSFEGQSTIALGVRAQLPFRAFILTGPGTGSMLVVDVAHLW
jgi:hypothetical protein